MSRRTRSEGDPQAPVVTSARNAGAAVGPPWQPPTRRAFVAMLGAAAALLAVRDRGALDRGPDDRADDDRPPSAWTGTTRWIGHC